MSPREELSVILEYEGVLYDGNGEKLDEVEEALALAPPDDVQREFIDLIITD